MVQPAEVELLPEARMQVLGPYRPIVEPLLKKVLVREAHRRPLISGVEHLVSQAIVKVQQRCAV